MPEPEQIPLQQPLSEREAVIYVPGLFPVEGDQTADRIGQRIAASFEVESSNREAAYRSAPAFEFAFGDAKVNVVTVTEHDGDRKPKPLVDVYALDYGRSFRDAAAKRPPIVQAAITALLVLFNVHRIVASLFRPAQSLGRRLQALWGVGLLVAMMTYVGLLGYTAFEAARTFYRGQTEVQKQEQKPEQKQEQKPASTTTPAKAQQKQAAAAEKAPAQDRSTFNLEAIILILTALGLVTRASLKELISRIGMEASGALGYIAYNMKSGAMLGAVDHLVNDAHEQARAHGIRYGRVHIIGYSFGSVISLDSLFPRGGQTPPPSASAIDGLVTIACPFDFIRSYWPDYFMNRGQIDGAPKRWLNIYRRDDILASNFNDGAGKPRGVGIKGANERMPENFLFGPDEPAGADALLLQGFRAHGDYWSKETLLDRNAFNEAVAFLFRGYLSAPATGAAEVTHN